MPHDTPAPLCAVDQSLARVLDAFPGFVSLKGEVMLSRWYDARSCSGVTWDDLLLSRASRTTTIGSRGILSPRGEPSPPCPE